VRMGEQSEGFVDVILQDAGERPIRAYEAVHRLTELNAKQARRLVDTAPQPIFTRMPKDQADAIKIELEAMGAIVDLKASD
jgi:large subunit ribosomal protein L7/L12